MPLATINIEKLCRETLSYFIENSDFDTLKNALNERKPLSILSESLQLILEKEYRQDKLKLIDKLTQEMLASQQQEDEKDIENAVTLVSQYNEKLMKSEKRLLELESGNVGIQEQLNSISEQVKNIEANLSKEQLILENLQNSAGLRYPIAVNTEEETLLSVTNNTNLLSQINKINHQGNKCSSLDKQLEMLKQQHATLQQPLDEVNESKTKLNQLDMKAHERANRLQERENKCKDTNVLLSQENRENLEKSIEQGISGLDHTNDQLLVQVMDFVNDSYQIYVAELELSLKQRNIDDGKKLKIDDRQSKWLEKRIEKIKHYLITMEMFQKRLSSMNQEKTEINKKVQAISEQISSLISQNKLLHPDLFRKSRNKALEGGLFWLGGTITSSVIIIVFASTLLMFAIPSVFAIITAIFLTSAIVNQFKYVHETKKLLENNIKMNNFEQELRGCQSSLELNEQNIMTLQHNIDHLESKLQNEDDLVIENVNTECVNFKKENAERGSPYSFHHPISGGFTKFLETDKRKSEEEKKEEAENRVFEFS